MIFDNELRKALDSKDQNRIDEVILAADRIIGGSYVLWLTKQEESYLTTLDGYWIYATGARSYKGHKIINKD